jgi:HEAT repeat protein
LAHDALPALLDRLADPDGAARRAAADGLADIGNQAALSALERVLPTEAVEKTRLAMAQAIAELRPSGGTRGEE